MLRSAQDDRPAVGARRGAHYNRRVFLLPRIENRVLLAALTVSVGVHLVVLAVRFVKPELLRHPAAMPPLEVVLVNARSQRRPEHAQVLAQVDLNGGGNNAHGRRTSPLPASADNSEGDALQTAQRTIARLEAEQRVLLATYKKNERRARVRLRRAERHHAPAARRTQTRLARMEAAIDKEISDYQARPRVHYLMPSTRGSPDALYFAQWRARVEKVGNAHYPAAARGKIYGTLQMTVIIDRSGRLVDAVIDRSSGSAVLDDAARRIVMLAAPFPPLPPGIARNADRLEITRSWIFTHDQLQTETPRENSAAAPQVGGGGGTRH